VVGVVAFEGGFVVGCVAFEVTRWYDMPGVQSHCEVEPVRLSFTGKLNRSNLLEEGEYYNNYLLPNF